MARRRLELRHPGHRAALVLPRVTGPAWGLWEYWRATGEPDARQAALRAARLFLDHRLFRSLGTGKVIRRDWLTLHYPPYWHYDILQALLVLSRMGLTGDPRCRDALAVLERRAAGAWDLSAASQAITR